MGPVCKAVRGVFCFRSFQALLCSRLWWSALQLRGESPPGESLLVSSGRPAPRTPRSPLSAQERRARAGTAGAASARSSARARGACECGVAFPRDASRPHGSPGDLAGVFARKRSLLSAAPGVLVLTHTAWLVTLGLGSVNIC